MKKLLLKSRPLVVLALPFLLGSCEQKPSLSEKMLSQDKPFIREQNLVDSEKFMKESAKRTETIAQHGPVTEENDVISILNYARELINKEEAKSYVSLQDSANINVFPIDVNVENTEIRTFAQMLSKVTGVNILVSDEVRGYVTAKLQNVPWPSALDSILDIKSLAKHVNTKAKIIRIHSQDAIVKLEDFERNRQEAMQKTVMLERASDPLYTEVFKLFYTKPATVKTMLEDILGIKKDSANNSGLRNTTPQITVDERMNQLIVKARKEDADIISKLIRKVDNRTKQVLIEAFIVEVTDDFEKALGARLGFNAANTLTNVVDNKTINTQLTGLAGSAADAVTAGTDAATLSNLPVTSAFGGIGILAGIGTSADLKAELTAMEKEGLTKVISNPRVFTLDNQEAIIFQGDEVPYETVSQEGTSVQFKEAGLKLAVVPSVVGDGNLVLGIQVNKDTVDSTQANPPITKSEIKTSLVSKDGSIVVIGGIYTQEETGSVDKVPLFGDIPVLGHLFRRDTKENNRKELMIFIAPKII